jgi:hypothetical protein
MVLFPGCDCCSCAPCVEISATGFDLSTNCYVLTDITQDASALGDWPQFPQNCGSPFVYDYQTTDSEDVPYGFTAQLSIAAGGATLLVTLTVDGDEVWSATYEKLDIACLAPDSEDEIVFTSDDITSETGTSCGAGQFIVRPCRCKCVKVGKSLSTYAIYTGACGSIWRLNLDAAGIPILHAGYASTWVCIQPGTCAGLAAGDIRFDGPIPAEISGLPPRPVSHCRCFDNNGPNGPVCVWAADIGTDHYGNSVAIPWLEHAGTCPENPLP